jgi:hypothetical protein
MSGIRRGQSVNGHRLSILALSVTGLLMSCTGSPPGPGTKEGADGYVCTLTQDTVEQAVGAQGLIFQAGLASTRTLALTVDARTRNRTYLTTLIYEASGGGGINRSLNTSIGKWLPGLGPSAKASVEGAASIGFVYESHDETAAQGMLGKRLPPPGWSRLIITLGGNAAGSASTGLFDKGGGRLSVEVGTKAYLSLYTDRSFSVTRSWSGRLDSDGPRWLLDRLGIDNNEFPTVWRGRVDVSYDLHFRSDGRPERLTTVASTAWGSRLRQATRVLSLTDDRNLSVVLKAMGDVIIDPFYSFSAGQVFFLNRRGVLWPRLTKAETMARATYLVDSEVRDYALAIGPFGIGYRHERTSRKLLDSHIRYGGGRQDLRCDGESAVPRPPKEASKHRELRLEQMPWPPSPSPSATPSATTDASPSVTPAFPTPTISPSAPPDETASTRPNNTPPRPDAVSIPLPGPLDM